MESHDPLANPDESQPVSPEDLGFWYADQPRQRTTMAMLILLDRVPERDRLRAAVARAVEAVPRLQQRIVDAPFDLAMPRWENDPTFDLDFHVRSYSLDAAAAAEPPLEALLRTVGPIYERAFDRTRPLWEVVELDRPDGGSALFFRLHHAVADGVGANAIMAALTDAERDVQLPPYQRKVPNAWPESDFGQRLREALRHRIEEDFARWRAVGGAALDALREPRRLARARDVLQSFRDGAEQKSQSPLQDFGRSRRLAGFDLDFEPLRETRRELGGRMIDVLMTAAASAAGAWARSRGLDSVEEILALATINMRPPEDLGLAAGLGNRTTGIMVPVPIASMDPLRRFEEVRRRIEERKAQPSVQVVPTLAAAMAALPRPLYRRLAYAFVQNVDLVVTNVPGVMQPRFVAGAEIEAAYPFAPVLPRCPVSVALYGYRGRLFVGLDADATAMPDTDVFRGMLAAAFQELVGAARGDDARA